MFDYVLQKKRTRPVRKVEVPFSNTKVPKSKQFEISLGLFVFRGFVDPIFKQNNLYGSG